MPPNAVPRLPDEVVDLQADTIKIRRGSARQRKDGDTRREDASMFEMHRRNMIQVFGPLQRRVAERLADMP